MINDYDNDYSSISTLLTADLSNYQKLLKESFHKHLYIYERNLPIPDELTMIDPKYISLYDHYNLDLSLVIFSKVKITKNLLSFLSETKIHKIKLVDADPRSVMTEFLEFLVKLYERSWISIEISEKISSCMVEVMKNFFRIKSVGFFIQVLTTRIKPRMFLCVPLGYLHISDSDLGDSTSSGATNVNILFESLKGCLRMQYLKYDCYSGVLLKVNQNKIKQSPLECKFELKIDSKDIEEFRKLFLFDFPKQIKEFEFEFNIFLSVADAKFMTNILYKADREKVDHILQIGENVETENKSFNKKLFKHYYPIRINFPVGK